MHALHRAQRCTLERRVCILQLWMEGTLPPPPPPPSFSRCLHGFPSDPPAVSFNLSPSTNHVNGSLRGLNNVYTRVYKRDVFTHANGPRLRPMTFVFDARWWSLWWGWEDSCIDALHEIYFDRCSMDDKIMKIKFKGYFFLFAFAFGLNHVCQEFYIMHADSLYNFWSIWKRMNEQWEWRD